MKQDRNLHVRIDYFPWRPEAYQLQADEIFDLIACGETIEIGKERFPAVLTQYAEEYKKNYDAYCKDARRRHHLPYMERVWALGTAGIDQMIVFVGEAELRQAAASPCHRSEFWQRLCSVREDAFFKQVLRIARERGLRFDELTQEQEDELVQQAMYDLEQEREERFE